MSTKYAFAICDTNDRASKVFENFLDSNRKFDALDVVCGNRLFPNYQRHGILGVNDLPIMKAKFMSSFNMYFMSVFNEDAVDLPKPLTLFQNMADVAHVVVMANGKIDNKELIARQHEFGLGQSLPEFIANFYLTLTKKQLNTFNLANMIRDIECDTFLSFIIFDKNKNEILVYNRGDELFISNIPGSNVIITTEIIPYNSVYPRYNFHKLPANCALKIDSKTMLVQYIPILCNTFSFGKDLMIDTDKALLFTDTCDMELCSSLSLLTNKDIANITDLQVVYFGFNTDIDKLIFDKINKLRKLLKVPGKSPVHIPFNFNNIYMNESEVIDDINRKIAESVDIENELDPDKKKTKKASKIKENINNGKGISLKDSSLFEAKRINYIATTLINFALEKGVGNIIIPNINRRNNRLISVLKSLAQLQTNTPLYIYSIFDECNTMDLIRYLLVCKNLTNLDELLTNSNRTGMVFEIDNSGKPVLKYNIETPYNEDVYYAFVKVGYENPFEARYTGKQKINNLLANAALTPDKVMTDQQKNIFLNMFTNVIKNEIQYQRKIQSF